MLVLEIPLCLSLNLVELHIILLVFFYVFLLVQFDMTAPSMPLCCESCLIATMIQHVLQIYCKSHLSV